MPAVGLEPIDILTKALILLGFFLSVSIFVSIYTQKKAAPQHDHHAKAPPYP